MTQDEKRHEKAMLLLEHQEAEENLALLRAKAARISQAFTDIGIWMSEDIGVQKERLSGEIRSQASDYRNNLAFDAALGLMNEIAAAERLLKRLQERKESLGLK